MPFEHIFTLLVDTDLPSHKGNLSAFSREDHPSLFGITLHANECTVGCYDCVYLGIDYSFINWTQCQDRIHRIGQNYLCSYTYLLTVDGCDQSIYTNLQAKANTSNAVYKAGKEF